MLLTLVSMTAATQAAAATEVPRFGVFEAPLEQAGTYPNPYTAVTATATFEGPGGAAGTIPLFWHGGKTWKLRFSPDAKGAWKWRVRSSDAGLDGQSGSFRCVASKNRGSVASMPGHPYHFAYQDGTPMWWCGETAWALYTNSAEENHNRTTVEHYLDVRAAQGFNVIHSMVISEADWGNDGGMPFHDLGAETINPAYWREVDARLQSLTRRGIIAGLVLAWTDKGKSTQSWQHFPSDPARLRYARYVVARYSAFPVYFVVAGEWNASRDDETARRMCNAIAREIQANDPHRRMRAIHPGGQNSPERLKPFAEAPWNDFGDYQQNYSRIHANLLACRDQSKPVVNSEYAYYRREAEDGTLNKPNSASAEITRACTWDIVMGGGYFVAGFGTTYFGGLRCRGPFDPDAAKNDDWEEQVQHVREFFMAREWWKLEPHDELISAPVPRGEHAERSRGRSIRPPRVTYWALADIGSQYIAYIRGYEGECTLALGDAPPTTYAVRRFDPRTGEYTALADHSGAGPASLTTPDEQDWVFEVRASSRGGGGRRSLSG